MLVTLSIQKIALIDELHLDFGAGLNVFTGETGAGKSILLDAIGLLLGNRGTIEMIRQDAESALVEASFHIEPAVQERLKERFVEWGLDEPSSDLMISRTLHRTGRTVCRVDGRLATVQMLREIGRLLVQQHGQHENLELMRASEQLDTVDLYGQHAALVERVTSEFQAWTVARDDLAAARMDEQTRSQRLDMLAFQIDEIRTAKLQPGEEESLRAARSKLQNLDKLMHSVTVALEALEGTGGATGAVSAIAAAAAAIDPVQTLDDTLLDASRLLETASIHTDEATRALADFLNRLDLEPDQYEQVEERFQLIRSLQRKYGATVDDVLHYLAEIEAEHQSLTTHEATLAQLENEVKAARTRLAGAAEELHQMRTHTAASLSHQVEAVLRQLNMPDARLQIEVKKRSGEDAQVFRADGCDDIVFLFSANKGSEPRPLAKVASGGELSRTMLALKSVLAKVDGMETLIFDEIDAGVSGEAAGSVARQLFVLAQDRQVLCVTHAPQIAAAADSHFVIRKVTDNTAAKTSVALLEQAGRVAEIARLVGAAEADETAQMHAQALMEGFHRQLHVTG